MATLEDSWPGRGDLGEVLERARDGVCVVGADGRIVLWNRGAEKIMRYTFREALGRRCCEIFGGLEGDGNSRCAEECHAMNLVTLSEAIQNFDMQTRAKDGEPVWINVSVLAGTPRDKTDPLMIHVFRDVTTTRELLQLVRERLERSSTKGRPVAAGLTRRELEVLRLMTTLGVGTTRAAERLRVSPATIRNHVQNILGKLGVHSRLEAVAYANKHRML
jgi:PAS domain S-box-containing protein